MSRAQWGTAPQPPHREAGGAESPLEGLVEFRASVSSQNRAMLDVFAHSGLPQRSTHEAGVTDLVMRLDDAMTSAGRFGG